MGMLRRFLRRIRRDGVISTFSALCSAALRPERLWLYRLEKLVQPIQPAGVQVLSGVETLRRLRAEAAVAADEFYCDDRVGFEVCHVATCEGKLAGVIWTIKGWNASRYVELQNGEAELSYLYVVPWARGRGIAKLLYASAACEQLRRGASGIYAVIAETNEPSRRAAEAVGFCRIASLRRSFLWGPRFRSASDGAFPAPAQGSGRP